MLDAFYFSYMKNVTLEDFDYQLGSNIDPEKFWFTTSMTSPDFKSEMTFDEYGNMNNVRLTIVNLGEEFMWQAVCMITPTVLNYCFVKTCFTEL